jgi:4-aminobutyrate aminotransferase-like enzyme
VSDIGQNFYLKDTLQQEFILKIANPAEKKDILDAQNQALNYLASGDQIIQCPRVFRSKLGNQIEVVKDQDGQEFHVRLLTYIRGKFLNEVQPQTNTLLFNMGRFLAQLDKKLLNFEHVATFRYWHWDLKNVMDLLPYTKHIKDARKRSLCEYFLLQFETTVLSRLRDLRSSIIHNDANDHNLLINDSEQEVAGIIDFGDMVHTYTICELAIALAYIMMGKENPLAAAITVIQGYHSALPLQEIEIEVLLYLITARLCTSVVMSSYQRTIQKDNVYLEISEGAAQSLLHKVLQINPIHATRIFREACNMTAPPVQGMPIEKIIKTRAVHIGSALSLSYQKPLKITRGAMQYLFDDNGKTFLDCVNNVCHVGHCHPRVVRAAQSQIAILNTNTRYLHEYLVQYAQRLCATLPDPLSVCYLVNSGSEANELALRMAQNHTNQKDFIVVDGAYHGHTSALIELSPYKFDGPGGSGMGSNIQKVTMPDIYRGPYHNAQAGKQYAQDVKTAITKIENQGRGVAAFFCEPLLSCAGQIVLPEGYLQKAYQHIRRAGGICVADEVQIGFGRVGTHFWGFETQQVIPDIVTMGKPIGNGHPLAAVITTPGISQSFDNGMEYFNTYGGNPVSCVIGMAVLDVIEEEGLQKNALLVGDYFKNRLNAMKTMHNIIGDVRGLGLFIGVELVTEHKKLKPAKKEAKYIIERMKEEGVLLSIDGPLQNVIKIKPPLVFTKENVDFVIERLDRVLHELE